MDSEKAELETFESEISSLTQETLNFRSKRTRLEKPQNFGEGLAWGFFGIGAGVAAGKRASLYKSIESNESKLGEERALQATHQPRYNDASGQVEKAKLALIDLNSHQADINKHIHSLKDVQTSSSETLRFVVDRKNTFTRIHTDLVNMTRFATRYTTHQYDEQASAKFLTEGITDVLDVTSDWPGHHHSYYAGRYSPALASFSSRHFRCRRIGRGERWEKQFRGKKFDRVIEDADRNYRKFAETGSSVPRLDDYLRDVGFDWEKTIDAGHKMISDAQDTRLRPARVVEQY